MHKISLDINEVFTVFLKPKLLFIFQFYLRLQGLEKALEDQIPDITDGNVEKVLEILSKIDIEQRRRSPLQLELVLINNGKAVQYFSANEKNIGARIRSSILFYQLN